MEKTLEVMSLSKQLREKIEKEKAKAGDTPKKNWKPDKVLGFTRISPMLAKRTHKSLEEGNWDNYIAEEKYDGTRIILEKFDGEVRIFSRNWHEYTSDYPKLIREAEAMEYDNIILDGEFVFFDKNNVDHFISIQANKETIQDRGLHYKYMVFDILVKDGEKIENKELMKRKKILREVIPGKNKILFAPFKDSEFQNFYEAVTNQVSQGEGIMLKKKNSPYVHSRSKYWLKVKKYRDDTVEVIGYTKGEGARKNLFGSLVIRDPSSGEKLGRVGTGFNDRELQRIKKFMEDDKIVRGKDKNYMNINNPFLIDVRYQEKTEDGSLRFPVFLKRRSK